MAQKKAVKTLSFNRETLRVLDDHELEQIAGGASATCNSCTSSGSTTCCGTDGGGGGTGPFVEHQY